MRTDRTENYRKKLTHKVRSKLIVAQDDIKIPIVKKRDESKRNDYLPNRSYAITNYEVAYDPLYKDADKNEYSNDLLENLTTSHERAKVIKSVDKFIQTDNDTFDLMEDIFYESNDNNDFKDVYTSEDEEFVSVSSENVNEFINIEDGEKMLNKTKFGIKSDQHTGTVFLTIYDENGECKVLPLGEGHINDVNVSINPVWGEKPEILVTDSKDNVVYPLPLEFPAKKESKVESLEAIPIYRFIDCDIFDQLQTPSLKDIWAEEYPKLDQLSSESFIELRESSTPLPFDSSLESLEIKPVSKDGKLDKKGIIMKDASQMFHSGKIKSEGIQTDLSATKYLFSQNKLKEQGMLSKTARKELSIDKVNKVYSLAFLKGEEIKRSKKPEYPSTEKRDSKEDTGRQKTYLGRQKKSVQTDQAPVLPSEKFTSPEQDSEVFGTRKSISLDHALLEEKGHISKSKEISLENSYIPEIYQEALGYETRKASSSEKFLPKEQNKGKSFRKFIPEKRKLKVEKRKSRDLIPEEFLHGEDTYVLTKEGNELDLIGSTIPYEQERIKQVPKDKMKTFRDSLTQKDQQLFKDSNQPFMKSDERYLPSHSRTETKPTRKDRKEKTDELSTKRHSSEKPETTAKTLEQEKRFLGKRPSVLETLTQLEDEMKPIKNQISGLQRQIWQLDASYPVEGTELPIPDSTAGEERRTLLFCNCSPGKCYPTSNVFCKKAYQDRKMKKLKTLNGLPTAMELAQTMLQRKNSAITQLKSSSIWSESDNFITENKTKTNKSNNKNQENKRNNSAKGPL